MGWGIRIGISVRGGVEIWAKGSWYVKGCGKIKNGNKAAMFSKKGSGDMHSIGLKGKEPTRRRKLT